MKGRPTSYWLAIAIVVATLTGLIYSRSTGTIFSRQFNVRLPEKVGQPRVFVQPIPGSRVVSVWFSGEVTLGSATELVSRLGLREEEADYLYDMPIPDHVRTWWNVGERSNPEVERHVWTKSSGNVVEGYTYAIWENGILYLFRHGIPLAR